MPNATPGLDTILCEAVEIADAADRAAYLDRACGPDTALRVRAEALVAAHFRAASRFLERPPAAPDSTTPYAPVADDSPAPAAGASIGPYKLRERIGEGGMGLVFVAEQEHPVRRKVALKVIKPGMDSRQVVARFEAERQALALMDHPNIARVFDAGTTPEGRPYFVMELVRGVPLTAYCDAHTLPVRDRLALFLQVCQAVQHAHQKGVIHRDLKPGNVLVAVHDVAPVAKVIDFGIAKAVGQSLTDKTVYTAVAQLVGTPLYMSPEQAGGSGLDVDTRTDVYALGVMLYELLTGTTPIDPAAARTAGYDELRRMIREDEPPRPSARLSTLAAAAGPTVADRRGADPGRLARQVRGELDWVVMKCLEKDRNRRYDGAGALAADLQRYLADEPVQARPASTAYRARKFVRRNKGRVVAAGLVLLALVGGVVGTTLGLVEARRQRDAADAARQAEADRAAGERAARLDAQEKEGLAVAAAAKERAATELTAARLRQIEAINATVFDIFEGFDIRKVRKGNDPVEAVLARKLIEAGEKLDARAIHDPLVLAGLRDRLGHTLIDLGQAPAAIDLLAAAVAARAAGLGPDHPDTLTVMNDLAAAYHAARRLGEALPLLERTLALRKAGLGPDHPHTLRSMNDLAAVYLAGGEAVKLAGLLKEQLADARKSLPKDSPQLGGLLAQLGMSLLEQKQWAAAEPHLRECLAIREKVMPEVWLTFNTRSQLGGSLLGQGKPAEAEPLLVAGYEGMKRRAKTIPPEGRVRLPEAVDRLVALYELLGKPDEAARWRAERAKYPFVAPPPRPR